MGAPLELPVPASCRYCAGEVHLVSNAVVFGRPYGRWPNIYLCRQCSAYVGTHPGTAIPLGTLADTKTRQARKLAHASFDSLWRDGRMTRSAAYRWLANAMGLAKAQCHIALFEAAQCARVVELCRGLSGEKPLF
ncbi:zinc-finger-containing protein [Crenobacter sp. SG2305]|uniref:zinc-finger-containing protein n=1 Tax=Crenobacter oryzisoli TaxID=3056844 RepID=UPI0025AAF665|nr:zinc-finger-containing protein [Crenobacter sp. SG2305]MDN0082342.1 zinc-finger-containing protein [Crenobacter sp. SG2305]